MASRSGVLLLSASVAWAACPNGGVENHGRCWYLGAEGATCGQTCAAQGLAYDHFVAADATPMVPSLLGRAPRTKQFPWGRIECYVPSADRYHTAKPTQSADTGDNGAPQDWSVSICRLSCACAGSSAAAVGYPGCTQPSVVLRHAGAHAIFADVSVFGAAGCWQNDCKNSDKFIADSPVLCARTCSELGDCTHWTFGEQDGAQKCFFRKSDGGREVLEGWSSGTKACAPPSLPEAFQALKAADLLKRCDAGLSDACPDMAKAVNTWQFAIRNLKKAAGSKLDAGTLQYVNQIEADTTAFAAQMSDQNFPLIMANNRQVFQALQSWMESQPKASVPVSLTRCSVMSGRWILTVFTQPLCFDAAARVWDLIVCDGLQAVVLIALGVVKLWRSRLLQEDTEGILEMLSMRDGEPLAGGDIVKAALALEVQIAPGSISDGTGVRPSKLFAEWETACPAEVEDFRRAEAEICASKDDWYQSESQDSDAVVSIGEGGWCDEGAERGVTGATRSDQRCTSIAPVCSEMQAQDQVSPAASESGPPDAEGGQVVSHPIAAEAKVAVNPSMPVRKPSRSTAGSRNGGKRAEGDRGRAPGNPKRSSSLGCLVGPLQSGGPLMCEEDPLYSSPKYAGHRRMPGNPGRENGARTLKASGSPPAPAPDIRRGNRSAPSRSSSNQSWTSSSAGRSRGGLDLEVADEHRGLECKAIPVARKSRTSPLNSNKLPPSPAMSSREILEDLSMHGRTWPEQMAGLVGGKKASDTPASPTQRLPFTRTRSRNDREELEPPPSARIDTSEQSSANKSPQISEDRRVRSLSPRAGDRSQSPLDAGRMRPPGDPRSSGLQAPGWPESRDLRRGCAAPKSCPNYWATEVTGCISRRVPHCVGYSLMQPAIAR
ncbi:Tbc1d10b [Symbiodinium sp. CCMP2592]|nr:Tbc1d10b [Symbiodinium sp. CCMP2592]